MSSFMRLTCSSLGDLAIQTHGGRATYAALTMVYGSWTTTPTQSGTVIEAFRVLSTADKTVVRSEIRKLDQYASAAAESAESPARELVWLYSQTVDEPVQRRARVVGISFNAVDDNVVDASMSSRGALYDIAIERVDTWELEEGISRAWPSVDSMASCLSMDVGSVATAPSVVNRMEITTKSSGASYREIWAGWKSGVGGALDDLDQFDPTIAVNNLTVTDRIGGGTFSTSGYTAAHDGYEAVIRFANFGGTVQKTEHKPRFSVEFSKWNSSTAVFPALIWPQYAGAYHLLARYRTFAPDGASTTAPMFSISGINFFSVGAWDERLPIQYVTHTEAQWRTIDLGVVTIGGGVTRKSSSAVAFSKSSIGIAAGLPSASSNMTQADLALLYGDYGIAIDDLTLIPAESYLHVTTGRAIAYDTRLVVTADDTGVATAYVTEVGGTTPAIGGGWPGPPYAVLERATADSKNWYCPPWGNSKLIVHATQDGGNITDKMGVSVLINARTRSYAG